MPQEFRNVTPPSLSYAPSCFIVPGHALSRSEAIVRERSVTESTRDSTMNAMERAATRGVRFTARLGRYFSRFASKIDWFIIPRDFFAMPRKWIKDNSLLSKIFIASMEYKISW